MVADYPAYMFRTLGPFVIEVSMPIQTEKASFFCVETNIKANSTMTLRREDKSPWPTGDPVLSAPRSETFLERGQMGGWAYQARKIV